MTINEYINKYSSFSRIGKGGQKTVFKVTDDTGSYALKIIPATDDPRILQEISILQGLDIPSVPKIIDTGILVDDITKDQNIYMLEEYIGGRTLREAISKSGCVEPKLGISINDALLQIEVKLQELNILHRDIKPENIILGDNQTIYLIDFGIAKVVGKTSLTIASAIYGPCTPAYAPPELARNIRSNQDVRTDLYQIGVTVYEALTGNNPFINGASNKEEVIHRGETIIPPSVQIRGDTKGLWMQFLQMLMAKNPSQRPNTAKDALRYFETIKPTIIY